MIEGSRVLTEDDGVNDEEACYQACLKLEREGFWEEARRRYGVKSSAVPKNLDVPSLGTVSSGSRNDS
jgi:hypothetical protein